MKQNIWPKMRRARWSFTSSFDFWYPFLLFFSFYSFPSHIIILFFCRWSKWPVLIHVCKLCMNLAGLDLCTNAGNEPTNQHFSFWRYASCINCVLLTLFGSVWFIWTSCRRCYCHCCLPYPRLFSFFLHTRHILSYIACEICFSIDYLFMITPWFWVVDV